MDRSPEQEQLDKATLSSQILDHDIKDVDMKQDNPTPNIQTMMVSDDRSPCKRKNHPDAITPDSTASKRLKKDSAGEGAATQTDHPNIKIRALGPATVREASAASSTSSSPSSFFSFCSNVQSLHPEKPNKNTSIVSSVDDGVATDKRSATDAGMTTSSSTVQLDDHHPSPPPTTTPKTTTTTMMNPPKLNEAEVAVRITAPDSSSRRRIPPSLMASFASEASLTDHSPNYYDEEDDNDSKDKVAYNPKTMTTQNRVPKLLLAMLVILLGYTAVVRPSSSSSSSSSTFFSNDCIKVEGGGFSGFYYMHGVFEANRLNSVLGHDPGNHTYVCYSAGCLSVVAHWANYTGEEVLDFGEHSQYLYTSGQMPWINATEQMISNVLHGRGMTQHIQQQHQQQQQQHDREEESIDEEDPFRHESNVQRLIRTNPKFLSSLHIITTVFPNGHPTMAVRTPQNLDELHEMLVQTCWLPFATGQGWTRQGHADGAFTSPFHPRCPRTVTISSDCEIYFNMVNVLMAKDMARILYERGLKMVLPALV